MLTVTASNAETVTVTGSDGSSYNLAPVGGTQKVIPSSTTTYTATAVGASGKATAMATVAVGAAAQPTVSITASPGTINAGGSSTLTVTAANATSVTITGTDGSSYSLQGSGGTQSVSPSGTTTYTATATGTGGKATATATVTVAASPTVTITASPTSVAAGASSTLTVTAANASTVTVAGSDGTSYNLPSTGGTQKVTPAQTTTYTATATASSGTTAKASVTITVTGSAPPTVSIVANPLSIAQGNSSTLTVTATNASTVTISGSDSTSYNLQPNGGTQSVSPSSTTTYTATATGPGGTVSATATVTVIPAGSIKSIDHIIFMLQENRSFDTYFGMLNSYRRNHGWTQAADGKTYAVDGLEDANGNVRNFTNADDENQTIPLFKFSSTCIDDMSSAWLESYGDVYRWDFSTNRPINMDGFVHTAENFDKTCAISSSSCSGSGTFTDSTGRRAMGYYDSGFLNYYYYMASQFALSDRWFSPVSSKSISNRIATFSGGTTQGLVKDPGTDDGLSQLAIATIFQELDQANVSWKIYYTVDESLCSDPNDCSNTGSKLPATDFGSFQYSYQYMYENPSGATCTGSTQPSSVVGDSSNSFCIDPNHIAPLSQYFKDVANGTLPSFAFIEAGYGNNDEHPGSNQSIVVGEAQVASIINALMQSPSWKDSVFFFSFDEGGGPFDHVPPVPGSSNKYTDPSVVGIPLSSIPDISAVAVNPDSYKPCLPNGTVHCDLAPADPGAQPTDAPAVNGFAAQLGFRVPNFVISPFTKAHYVSHNPMDHTAIIKFVENRFIGSSAHLTNRDAAQPDLLDFFDFTGRPWATPPTPPVPPAVGTSCNAGNMGP